MPPPAPAANNHSAGPGQATQPGGDGRQHGWGRRGGPDPGGLGTRAAWYAGRVDRRHHPDLADRQAPGRRAPPQRSPRSALGIDAATLDLLSTLRRACYLYRLTAGAVAELSLVSAGAISQRVARAEREGLVRRERSPADGRLSYVTLTAAGHALIERSSVDGLLPARGSPAVRAHRRSARGPGRRCCASCSAALAASRILKVAGKIQLVSKVLTGCPRWVTIGSETTTFSGFRTALPMGPGVWNTG